MAAVPGHLVRSRVREVLPSAFTIAFLAGVESLLSAVVADGMTGRRHRSNCELVAQGVANIASALFGGLPATGAIARTATNIRAGARSPIAGMLHAAFVLAFMLLFARWACVHTAREPRGGADHRRLDDERAEQGSARAASRPSATGSCC